MSEQRDHKGQNQGVSRGHGEAGSYPEMKLMWFEGSECEPHENQEQSQISRPCCVREW